MAFQPLAAGLPAEPIGIAAGAAVAGRLASARGAFHGGIVAVLAVAAQAIAEPLRPLRPPPPDVAADLAQTIAADVGRLALGTLFGWIGGFRRR